MPKRPERSQTTGKSSSRQIDARSKLARDHILAGEHEKALKELLWLWTNIGHSEAIQSPAGILLPRDMKELARKYSPAQVKFTQLRNACEKTARKQWILLNDVLEEENRTLAWFDKAKTKATGRKMIITLADHLRHLLLTHNRWADYALLHEDPIADINDWYTLTQSTKQTIETYDPFPQEAARLYASLLAAGRDKEAEKVAKLSLDFHDTDKMRRSLVDTATAAGQPRASQVKWILKGTSYEKPRTANGYMERGIELGKLSLYDLAMIDLNRAVRMRPKDARGYAARGYIFAKMGDRKNAIADFDQALELDPKSAESYFARGKEHCHLNDSVKGIKDLTDAIELGFDSSELYEWLGWAHANLHDYTKAVEAFKQAIKRDPKCSFAHRGLGRALQNIKQYARAIESLNRCLKLDRNDDEALYLRAWCHARMKLYHRAIEDFNQAIALGENDPYAYYGRAAAKIELTKFDEALQDLEHCIELKPDYAEAYAYMGWLFEQTKKTDKAIAAYSRAVQHNRDYAYAYKNRADLHYKNEDFEDAAKDFGEFIRLDADNPFAYIWRARCYEKLKKRKSAQNDYKRATECKPRTASQYLNRGEGYCELRLYAQAMQDFDEALKLDPENAAAYDWRAWCHSRQKQHREAVRCYTAALKVRPGRVYSLEARAREYYELKRFDLAVKDLNNAIKQSPDMGSAYHWRGMCHSKQGKHEQAAQDFSKAIELGSKTKYTYHWRATAFGALGRWKEAIEDVRKFLDLEQTRADGRVFMALHQADLQQFRQIIDEAERASELAPEDARILRRVTHGREGLKQQTMTFSTAEITRKLKSPKDGGPSLQGMILMELKQDDRAIKEFKKALQHNPDDGQTYIFLSTAYHRKGEYNQSYEAADRAIQLMPDCVQAYVNRAKAAINLGKLREALADLNNVIEKESSSVIGEAHYYRAKVYEHSGNRTLAEVEFSAARKLGFAND